MGTLVPLIFVKHVEKFYARTPTGEWAYGENQGLYEWRDGKRLHYTGGDRQCSSNGAMWTEGPPVFASPNVDKLFGARRVNLS